MKKRLCLFLKSNALTNWLLWVERSAVDGAKVSWQFIETLARLDIPDVSETVRGAGGDVVILRRPAALQKVLEEELGSRLQESGTFSKL